MRGNEIVVSADPLGHFTEGVLGGTLNVQPGQILQLQTATALVGGRFTYVPYQPGSNGVAPLGPYFVALVANLWGRMPSVQPNPPGYSSSTISYPPTFYTPGDRLFLYTPYPGDELNLLIADGPGTGSAHNAGELEMVQNGTGKLIPQTGSLLAPFVLLETLAALTTDTLGWCQYKG